MAKTWLEMARLQLKKNSKLKARYYAQKTWNAFSSYGEIFFPDNLRYLLLEYNPDKAANRFFGAERGGLFWYKTTPGNQAPIYAEPIA